MKYQESFLIDNKIAEAMVLSQEQFNRVEWA